MWCRVLVLAFAASHRLPLVAQVPRGARHPLTPFAMAKKQKPRATRAVHVNGHTIRVAQNSDLSPSIIKLMVEHQAELAELHGEDYHLRGGYGSEPQNRSLAAAFRAKGLIH